MAFLAGAITLIVTLQLVLKDAGDPSALARDPFTIRAAADECVVNPRRGSLDPVFLEQQLAEWAQCISVRSMELSIKTKATRLERTLTRAAWTSGFFRSLFASLLVYFEAFRRFPFRFGWPFLGLAVLVLGSARFADLDFTASLAPWFAVAVFTAVNGAVVMFYCATRGNRARLRHRINLVGLDDARNAIKAAGVARATVEAQDAAVQRVLAHADKFFQNQDVPAHNKRVIFSFGRIRVTITQARSSR